RTLLTTALQRSSGQRHEASGPRPAAMPSMPPGAGCGIGVPCSISLALPCGSYVMVGAYYLVSMPGMQAYGIPGRETIHLPGDCVTAMCPLPPEESPLPRRTP